MRVLLAACLAGLVILVLNRTAWRLDRDPGGYRPALGNHASYPKFYVHGVSGFAFSLGLAVLSGMAWQSAAAITILAGLWEVSAGFINPLDILASALGAWLAFLLTLTLGHHAY